LAVWVLRPGWLCRKLGVCDLHPGALVKPGGWGSAGRAPTLHRIPRHLLYNWRKSRKNLSQGNRKTLGWSAPNAIRLVDLAVAGDGLDWHAGHCRAWLSSQVTGSNLGQRKYLPCCRTKGSHIS